MKAALLLAVALGACAPAFAVDLPQPENRFAAAIAPAERFEIGGTLVERHGQRGRPLILVPGLGSGAWAWQDTVRQFSEEHVVYVVTLAGFDGRAPVAGNTLDNAHNSLRELIVSRKLAKPVLVGHSLGAALSIAFAEQHSDLIGGVVAVDGLPEMAGTPKLEVVSIAPSRHFVMFDQPRMLADALRSYLKSL